MYFKDTPGPYYKNDWHHVEAYFKLNSISAGKGTPDGQIRYWYDSKLLISYDNILFRTAQYPDMKLNQFLIAPYIGDGSPLDQTMWIDELTVATSPIKSDVNDNRNANQIYIYPIPAIDYIEIVGAGSEPTPTSDIRIFNAFGDCIKKSHTSYLHGAGVKIDVSDLPTGIYFVRIGNKLNKFVKI